MAIRSSGPDKGPPRTVRKGLKTGVLNVREDDLSGLETDALNLDSVFQRQAERDRTIASSAIRGQRLS